MRGLLASLEARAVARWGAWVALVAVTAAAVAHLGGRTVPGAPVARLAPLPYAAIAAGLLASHGAVSGPLRGGELLLWLQKPLSPAVLLLRWLAEVVLLTLTVVVLLALVSALAAATGGGGASGIVRLLPALLAWGATAAAVGFAVSAAGLYPDGILAVLWIFAVSPFLLLASRGAGWGATMAELCAFPYEHLAALQAALRSGGAGSAEPALHLLLHAGMWGGAGLLAGVLHCRSPSSPAARR